MKTLMKILVPLVLFSTIIHASSPQDKGFAVAKKMEQANEGFKGESSDMEMILISAYKEKVQRKMRGLIKEIPNESDRSLITFLHPADVNGTHMLTWAHKHKDDEQWLYLPSLRRVKRISSSAKTSSFMGSEFSYEDLGSQNIDKFNFELLNEDSNQWILERVPKTGKQSGYGRQKMWVSKKYIASTKIEYYDRKNELLKTATFHDYLSFQIDNKTFWRPSSIHMINTQTKKESIFTWTDRKIGIDIAARHFDQANLK